jgi:hypothetical protein
MVQVIWDAPTFRQFDNLDSMVRKSRHVSDVGPDATAPTSRGPDSGDLSRYPLGSMPLSERDAEAELDGLPLVPAVAGSIADMKALRDRCLEADLPALVGCPAGARGGG